jgi:hypothetical protein
VPTHTAEQRATLNLQGRVPSACTNAGLELLQGGVFLTACLEKLREPKAEPYVAGFLAQRLTKHHDGIEPAAESLEIADPNQNAGIMRLINSGRFGQQRWREISREWEERRPFVGCDFSGVSFECERIEAEIGVIAWRGAPRMEMHKEIKT